MFHSICGDRITLLNDNTTAKRDISEFNHGLVFSKDALKDNHLFEVRIERKVYTWSGGLEIGVTKNNPECSEVPANATDMKNGTWMLSGSSILKDGRSVLDVYGLNLINVEEGDIVGVMRTDQDELIFSLNGEYRGVAARHIPVCVFAVLDLYGQVAQASVVSYAPIENIHSSIVSNEIDTYDDSDFNEGNSLLSNLLTNFDLQIATPVFSLPTSNEIIDEKMAIDLNRLRFHEKCGNLVSISANGRSAERLRPYDEFNNGVVVTHRPLQPEELFEIRIDSLVEKWSGSIEVGVTMHNPEFLTFPATMTNFKTGTIMMSGCGILTNGKATRRDYGDFNLDELMVGDRIGLIRYEDGDLHYIINGLDQGVAAKSVPELIWGVVDLYGRTVKVTIVDRDEREDSNLLTRSLNMRDGQLLQNFPYLPEQDSDALTFHTKCGSHVVVINHNRTAIRPNALKNCNDGIVLTQRALKKKEPFEVKIDKIIAKWAGSIEIGVTTHSPDSLEFPTTMTNIRSGTWMMTANGVTHNGNIVLDDYGINLDRLRVGDRVAVVVQENGSIHLYMNGIDQGEVVANINDPVYGVIDLYGQVAQVTIIDYNYLWCCMTPSSLFSAPLAYHSDLRFSHIHGKNVRICNNDKTAFRPQPYSEFADAVVIGNRALKDNEMFAIAVERIIDRWSGNLEVGVTSVKLDEVELPPTMTDLDHDTWMLSGSTIMKDGQMLKSGYKLNLDSIPEGRIIGMMRRSDGCLHYYMDGIDQGEAYNSVPSTVYPVIDLYGRCAQVSLCVGAPRSESSSSESSPYQSAVNWSDEIPTNTAMFERSQKCFSRWCGKNVNLSEDYTTATRTSSHNHGLVFSSFLLEPDKLYEITVTKWSGEYAGSLSMGVTTISPEKMTLPPTISCLKPDVWYMIGDEIWHNGRMLKSHYGHNLHWLEKWSTVGIRVSMDGALHFYIDGQDHGIAANDIPVAVYAVVELYGTVTEVRMSRQIKDMMVSSWLPSLNMTESATSPSGSGTQDTLAAVKDILKLDDLNAERATMEFYLLKNFEKEKELLKMRNDFHLAKDWKFFHELRGRNIRLMNNGKTAARVESYNQGVIIVSRPLERNTMFEIMIDNLNTKWVSSLMIGVLSAPVMRSLLPVTAFGFKKDIWLVCGDSIYHNGHKIKARYGPNLDTLTVGQKVGIMVDSNNQLKLFVDDIAQGVAAMNIPLPCFVIVDVYGQCEQVSISNLSPNEESGKAATESSLLTANSQQLVNDLTSAVATELSVLCEKADLERHEKESPSDEESASAKSADECGAVSLSKRNKTNENIATVASYSHSSEITNLRPSKMNDNNVIITKSCNLDVADAPCRTNKTNSDSHDELSEEANAVLDSDRKFSSTTNCDHKTNLNIANSTCIQIEKSGSKSNKPVVKDKNSLINDRPITLYKLNPNCEHRILCLRFRDFLGLPSGFFSSDSSIICYCDSCYSPANHECKGVNTASFPVPVGWCKFPLKKHLMTNNVDAVTLEKWHVSFVGVPVGNVRQTLDRGQLTDKLKIGCLATNRQSKGNEAHSRFHIVSSPLIKCATDAEYISKYQYVDQKTKTVFSCSAAFQILVRPASYKIGTACGNTTTNSTDNTHQVNSLQWIIKEKESTVLSAVLFKLETIIE